MFDSFGKNMPRSVGICMFVEAIFPIGTKWNGVLGMFEIPVNMSNTIKPTEKNKSYVRITNLQGVFAMLSLYFSITSSFSGAFWGQNWEDGVMKRDGWRQSGHFLFMPE
jgi:hypothetical protein